MTFFPQLFSKVHDQRTQQVTEGGSLLVRTPIFSPQALDYVSLFQAKAESGCLSVPFYQPIPSSLEFQISPDSLTQRNLPLFAEQARAVISDIMSTIEAGKWTEVEGSQGLWRTHRAGNQDVSVLFAGPQQDFIEITPEYVQVGWTMQAAEDLFASMVVSLQEPLPSGNIRPGYAMRFRRRGSMEEGILQYLFPKTGILSSEAWSGTIGSGSPASYRASIRRISMGYDLHLQSLEENQPGLRPPWIDLWHYVEKSIFDASGIVLQ